MVGIVTYLPPKQFTVNTSFSLTINILSINNIIVNLLYYELSLSQIFSPRVIQTENFLDLLPLINHVKTKRLKLKAKTKTRPNQKYCSKMLILSCRACTLTNVINFIKRIVCESFKSTLQDA